MIEVVKDLPEGTLGFRCKGRVTKSDYDEVLVPAVEDALKRRGKIRLYYAIDVDFAGLDPGAMLEDALVGLKHLAQWERVAVVTDIGWIREVAGAFAFLIHGNLKTFPLAQESEARAWIVS